MNLAIGTSLIIIALKSFSGFFKYLDVLSDLNIPINWELVFLFTLIGAAGSLIGKAIGDKISNSGLQRIFAIFLIVMGGYILFMNL